MNRILVLHFGRCEDGTLCSIIARNDDFDFGSDKASIESLALDLLAIYKKHHLTEYSFNPCCLKNLKNKKNEYCFKCGTCLKYGFNKDAFYNWLLDLYTLTYDDFGSDYHSGIPIDGRLISWELGISPMDLVGIDEDEVNPVEDCAKVLFAVLEDLKLV